MFRLLNKCVKTTNRITLKTWVELGLTVNNRNEYLL